MAHVAGLPVRAADAPGLTFDEDVHRYYHEGQWVRSVTQILSLITAPLYARAPQFVLAEALERGSNVHGWTELIDLFEADVTSDAIIANDGTALLPEHAEWPYVQAWLAFKRESGFQPEIVEQRIWHPTVRYAGTVDRIGLLGGTRATLEIKTVAQLHPWVGLQTAAYHEGYNLGRPRAEQARDRYAVQLRKDGTYRLKAYRREDHRADFEAFIAMKQVWDWSDAHDAPPALLIEQEAA